MKKLVVFMLTLTLCVCAVFSLTACGGVEGTYKFESMVVSEFGVTYEIKAGEKHELTGITFTEDFMMVELKDDGTVIMTSFGEETVDRWEKEGDKICVYDEDGDQEGEFILDGDKLIVERDGMKITLVKK